MRLVALVIASGIALASRAEAQSADVKACVMAYEAAQRHRLHEEFLEAHRELRRCSETDCPALVREDCTKWLREVEQELPSMIIEVRSADGRDINESRALVDGSEVTSRVDSSPVNIDPGERVVRVEHAGRGIEKRLTIIRGEKNRIVRFVFPADESRPPPPPPAPGPALPPAPEPTRVPLAAWVFAGVGVAALAVGGYEWFVGLKDRQELLNTCAPRCPVERKESAERKLVIGDVFVGVGVVSGAVAAVLFVLSNRKPHADPPPLSFGLGVRSGGALLSVDKAF